MFQSKLNNLLAIAVIFVAFLANQALAQDKVMSPDDFLGYPLGDWHLRHDQIIAYQDLVAQQSDRIVNIDIGRSHQQRRIVLSVISSPDNLAQLDKLRIEHEQLSNANAVKPDTSSMPVFIWMVYSVHGDEASGAHAALKTIYHLLNDDSKLVNNWLQNAVIFALPVLNPDGLDRFSNWANNHTGLVANPDPQHREHLQHWPKGRTNHYWFDLNRDWLLLTQPESRAHINQLQTFKPNVVGDFHEMGHSHSYFFQPGIVSRNNPLTPQRNLALTRQLAAFQANAFDKKGELYFTEERYDDFYYGKGSSYPDAQGAVGILFEQGSARGQKQSSSNGLVTFQNAIDNQFIASKALIRGSVRMREVLLDYQREFHIEAQKLASDDDIKGFVLYEEKDKTRLNQLLTLLAQHKIEIYPINKNFKFKKKKYQAEHAYWVPFRQKQYRLLKSIFSERKDFPNNTFYDVSNWNLAHAFNIEALPITGSFYSFKPSKKVWQAQANSTETLGNTAYAWVFDWHDSNAPNLLAQLLNNGFTVKAAKKPFTANQGQSKSQFAAGSLVVVRSQQNNDRVTELQQLLEQNPVRHLSLITGYTKQGPDLGSNTLQVLKPIKAAVLTGLSVKSSEVGEVWHQFDQFYQLPLSMLDIDRLDRLSLQEYSHLIMVDGKYKTLSELQTDKIKQWVNQGGILILQQGAVKWASNNDWLDNSFLANSELASKFETDNLSFADRESFKAQQRIAGAVYQGNVDLSHPLAFGLTDNRIPLFKNQQKVMLNADKPFVDVITYQQAPLLAGYTSDINVELLENTASLSAKRMGKGVIVASSNNLLFRTYWRGSSRVFDNAIFFAQLLQPQR